MSDPQSVAEGSARAMYAQDHASQALGMRILEVRPGYARLSMTVREDMVNGHKLCHGGLIFTLADSAFAFACNTYNCGYGRVRCERRISAARPGSATS